VNRRSATDEIYCHTSLQFIIMKNLFINAKPVLRKVNRKRVKIT